MGGVLFIDEAYYHYRPGNERDCKREAIEILLQVMENDRDDLVVILAGYRDRMETFFQSNPGMRSRVAHHVDFPDFAPRNDHASRPHHVSKFLIQQLEGIEGSRDLGALLVDVAAAVKAISAMAAKGALGGFIGKAGTANVQGEQQVTAGYAIYGPATMLVPTVGKGTHGFTLDREIGNFVLTHPDLRIPEDTSESAINTRGGYVGPGVDVARHVELLVGVGHPDRGRVDGDHPLRQPEGHRLPVPAVDARRLLDDAAEQHRRARHSVPARARDEAAHAVA